MNRPDRAGKIGFQLAALVDLLFVVSFLLIWDREVLMHKRLQKAKTAAQVDSKKSVEAQKSTLEALAQAEKEKLKAQQEVRRLADQLAEAQFDRTREKKLDRDLHTQYEWMLEGMRKGKDAAVVAPAGGRGASGSAGSAPVTSGPAPQR